MNQGESGAIRGKELRPPLHLGVVAIEKGAFWSPSTAVANFTYIYIYYMEVSLTMNLVSNFKQ